MAASKSGGPQTGTLARGVALAALAAMVLWTLYLARNALLIIYISGLLAIGFGPIVRTIEQQTVVPVITRRLPRWLAILLVYIVMVGTLTIVGLLVVPPLIDQAQEMWARIPALLARGQAILMRYGLLTRPITLEEAVRAAPSTSGNAMDTVATAVTSVVGGLFGFLTIFVLTFYLLLESDTLFTAFARVFPRDDRPRVKDAARKISAKVSAWLNGQLILAGTIGASAAVGLYLLGVPYFYVLAVIAGFGEMIPVIGPILAAIPAVLVALSVSPKTALFVLIFYLVQQQVENHLLVPKVMERQVGVSAVTVIIALLIGGSVLGITGAILAVPSAAILQVLVQELLDERDRLSAVG